MTLARLLSLSHVSLYPQKAQTFNHSGQGNVSILLSDIPLGRAVSTSTARATTRRITEHHALTDTDCLQARATPITAYPRALRNPWNATLRGAQTGVCAA